MRSNRTRRESQDEIHDSHIPFALGKARKGVERRLGDALLRNRTCSTIASGECDFTSSGRIHHRRVLVPETGVFAPVPVHRSCRFLAWTGR